MAKGAKHREQAVVDTDVQAVVFSLRRRKGGEDGLFGCRAGRDWHDVTAADINGYLAEISEGEFTAKDLRTWHATVLAAVGLAMSEHAAATAAARKARDRPGRRRGRGLPGQHAGGGARLLHRSARDRTL
jgi:DNA topoisomerase I-like protein